MQNIDVRFNASSNFGKVKADLAALEAQAASLANVFSQNAYARPPALVDPTSWQASTRAVHEASNAYRNAVSSSGLLTTQQIRATAESERYTKALQKQKLTMGEMFRHRGIMKQVYNDQLRYQRMTAQYWGTDSAGRAITDITIPRNVPRDLDTVAQRIYFIGQRAKSAGTQIVNMGKNLQWAGRQLTVGFTYPVALFGAAAGVMAYKVDEAMTQVTKVYDVSAEAQRNEALRAKELNDVRIRSWDLARDAAGKYGQSIENTLGVEQALAATGLSDDKLFESVDAVSRIAALGDLDLTQSTDMTIALQTAFKDTIKTTDDLNSAFDYMNAVENATSLSIQNIAEATPRAASAMASLGVSVEEMTVLLTSMREAGVNAAEGANALKSATGTMLAPSPAADEFIKQISDGQVQVTKLAEQSGGNLYTALGLLYEQMEGLSDLQKQQIIVKLFGKYQFNRVSAMLDNLGAAFEGTENQTRKAMDLMGESAEELGDRSQQELGEKMAAASGKFNEAWQLMRIELAKVGEPFLRVAAIAAGVATEILEFFNGMSDWKKKAALGVAAVLALAGPVVMMGGLFMNLAGQFITGSGRIMSVLGKLGGAVGLVTKEEQAATVTAEAQNRALEKQQVNTSTLAKEVQVLTAAYEKATAAARMYAETQGVASGAQATAAATTAAAAQRAQTWKPATAQQQFLGMPGGSAAAAYVAPVKETAQAYDQAASRAQMLARTERERLSYQMRNNRAALAEQRIREKISGSINGAAIGTGVMAASMATMMLFSNETANNIAKWAMIGTVAVPAMHSLVSAGNSLVGGIGKAVTSARAATAGLTATATAMNVVKAGAMGFGTALNAALGPIGWITLGLTAVAGVFLAIKNHNDKIEAKQKAMLDEQIKATKTMQSSTRSIATNLGKAAGSYGDIINAGGKAMGATGSQSQMLQSYNYYKSDEGMEETKALQLDGKLLDTDALVDKVRGKYIDLQVIGKDTAEQAKTDVQAMLLAAGASATQAASLAEQVYREYGNVNKIDWAKPIEDQTNALDALARDAFRLNTSLITGGGVATYVSDFEIDEGAKKMLYTQAEKASDIFRQALYTSTNPEEARAVIDQYMTAATSQWQVGFDTLMASDVGGSDKVKDLFEKYGVDSGQAFADAMRNNEDFKNAYKDLEVSPSVNYALQGQLQYAREFATEYEHAFISPLAGASEYLGDNVLTAATALKQFNEAGIGLDASEAASKLMQENQAYQEYAAALSRINELKRHGYSDNSSEMLDAQNELNKASKALVPIINELNQQYGFKQGRTATKALKYLLGEVAAEAGKAENKVKGVDGALNAMPTRKTVTIQVKQVGGIIQDAMSNVQNAMAESAMNKFNSNWDARMDSVTASHEAAQDAMDRRQQAAQDAFDARWEARKKAVEAEYDRKIKAVEREIKAEQKADEIRQRLFEKEKQRLQRLAEMENNDIDFNTALNEGRLDDAAKVLNNAGVSSENDQMDAEQKAAEERTQAKIERLEKKNERLEKARDKELENLEKIEERMRKHLERVQDARRNALEKQQEDVMKSLDKQREYEEAVLEQRLELFKSYTARNQKDLERWMKEVGLSYDDFGTDVKAKGENWSKYFRKELAAQIRKAGTEVMNDNIWENVGKGVAGKLLKGLGFSGLADFRKFVKTGERGVDRKKDDTETRHEGGIVGSGTGSRKGVPNTYKGLHRSEKMIRAQKGEYVINKKASSQHRDVLDAINSGNYDKDGNRLPRSGGEFGNLAGLMTGAVSSMFTKGVEKSFQNNYEVGLKKEAKRLAKSGNFAGEAGTYGGRAFSAEQMRNAAIIASVGSSMGMSARDIQIGIMTAIAESGLVNVNYGDRDSLGLFQQRPSMGWGTPAQVTDPRYAARAFFGPLKAHTERNEESPWLAAQHIQRSAFADGSNYRVWWEAAQAIYKKGLTSKGGVSGPGGSKGSGKYWKASDGGKGWTNSHDYRNGMRSPVYAIGPGVVRAEQLGPSAGSGQHPNASPRGYGSYGVVSYLTTDDGQRVTYAHLYPGTQVSGRVQGGQRIALSASTGNSSGPHTHFEVNGSTDARGRFAAMGIPLRTGGTIKYDETPAVLHKGETVLTAPLTQKFKDAVSGMGGDTFHVTLDLRGAMIKEDVDIEKAVNKAIDARENKLGRKRVVR